jgi:DNA repair exonuclease SbcCD ATPase subunit
MLVVSATPMTALAAPKATEITAEQTQALNDMDLSFMFDAELYASLYPDVVAKVGNDPQALYQHFITFGINENRQFNRYFKVQDMENLFREYKTMFGDNHRLYVALAAQTLLEKATGTENVVATPDVMKTISTEQLNAQLALMQNRVAEIEKQIAVLETQLTEETSQETSSGSSEKAEEQKVILTKIQQLKVALNKYKNAVTLISEATELLTEAQSTASNIEDNLDQLELGKKYVVERIEDDNAKLASAQAALESAISQYQSVASELTTLCNDLASSLQTVATDTHYIEDNENRITHLTDTLDQMTEKDEKYAALSADLERFKQDTAALKTDRESATSTASGLRNDIAKKLEGVVADTELDSAANNLISDAEKVADLSSDIEIYTKKVASQDHIIEMETSRLNEQNKIIDNLEGIIETDKQNKAAAVEETFDVLDSFEDSDKEELGSEENQELRDDLHKFLDAENIQDDITDDGSDDDVNNDDTDDGKDEG